MQHSTCPRNPLHVLEFERPLYALREQLAQLAANTAEHPECLAAARELENQLAELQTKVYENLSAAQVLQIARHAERPHTSDLITGLAGAEGYQLLAGDRLGGEDQAIQAALLRLVPELPAVLVIGTEKGRDIRAKQRHNFGMPQPWGYRKARRLMQHAERFGLPVITLIDTPGAYPGLEAEAQGQSIAIAESIQVMAGLKVPTIAVITGEGGSGGALALGVADRVLMMQYAVYSVISPEGCAAILWRTREQAATAARALKITAPELQKLKLVDGCIPEPLGGAHQDPAAQVATLRSTLICELTELLTVPADQRLRARQQKFANYGFYEQK